MRNLKKLFTFNFKGKTSISSLGKTEGLDNGSSGNCTRLPLHDREEIGDFEPPTQVTEDYDADRELSPRSKAVTRLCEFEEEMISFRIRLRRMGERFSFPIAESLKHMMKAKVAEYEAKFRETLHKSVESQTRCMFLEGGLQKAGECLLSCELSLQTEKEIVLKLKDFLELQKESLRQEREKQKCLICKLSLRNTIIFPCLHFLYCGECLHDHHLQKRSNECPACGTSVDVAVNLNLKMV
ncbi:hypothetical protein R1flu_028299 [Riccia fluitans]|uniref:RING-type domain-containing protein n=1 Tax=Riccia fluitans TaxID=41844 RepID=A0ABD1XLA4_9MARC